VLIALLGCPSCIINSAPRKLRRQTERERKRERERERERNREREREREKQRAAGRLVECCAIKL